MTNPTGSQYPLEGIRILDLTRLIPGAFCTALLADAGAEIIKVEELHVGDYERQIHPMIGGMASRFLILNRNKKSFAVNLKTGQGRSILIKLAAQSDGLIEGFRPGVMKELGLDYDTLKKVNPGLIYCSISSFGQTGPYRDKVAHDINILGIAGLFNVTGTKNGPPAIPGVQLADSISGMYGAIGILMALMMRERTLTGQYIDISMFDGVMSLLFDAGRYAFAGEEVPGRGQGRLWGGFPNYNLYETLDKQFITVGSLETKFKNTLLEKLGRPDLMESGGSKTSTGPGDADEEIGDFLRKIFKTKTRDEWVHELAELNICVEPVNTVSEALDHPQTLARKMVREDTHPLAGAIRQIGSALKFSDATIDACQRPAPHLGEHTREILARIGFKDEQIEQWIDAGIIRTSETRRS